MRHKSVYVGNKILYIEFKHTKKKNTPRARHGVQSVIPELGWLRQEDLYEFKASLGYTVSSRLACTT